MEAQLQTLPAPAQHTRPGATPDLNAWLREVLAWHFDPVEGSPYWLRRAREMGFDPRREIDTFEDLVRFGPFPDEDLRRTPVRDFLPRPFACDPAVYDFYVMETGGTTGLPKRALVSRSENQTLFATWTNAILDAHHFGRGGDWLLAMPSGPHCVGLVMPDLIRQRDGLVFRVDLDPRWVKRCVLNGNYETANAYTDHVIDQMLAIFKSQRVPYMMVTSRLIEALAKRVPLQDLGLRGILCAGTHLTPETHRQFHEMLPETKLVCGYGNSLIFSMSLEMPHEGDGPDGWDIRYYPHRPYAIASVRRFDRPSQEAAYGEWGRVGLTTLTRAYFLPNFLERDEAFRVPPHPLCPWDGVANVRPWNGIQNVVEGIY